MTKTVLVADDEPEVREMVGDYLAARGWQVLQAQNGLEALLHVKRSRPQAIVLDVMMPRLGGLDALLRIHRFDPSITVVVVTAHPDDALRERALALGAVSVLTKPFELADLARALGVDGGIAAAHAPPVREVHAAPPPPAPAPARGSVLIVDDEESVRDLLVELLTAQGYSTHVAADGRAGVRAIMDLAIDVVLLDIDMPGISGINALVAIRAVAPRVAVIMVSGTADVGLAKQALASGAFDYVTKPIDFQYLRDSVHAAMEMKRLDGS